jgi:predicted nucleic acid-binding protein
MKALLDTTALIDVLKGDESAIKVIDKIRMEAVLYTTTINIYEYLRGIMILQKDKEKHVQALNVLVSNLNILEIDLSVAGRAAEIYADLRKIGVTLDEPDYLIAGACLGNDIDIIITRNERHFEKVKGLRKVITY